MRHGRDILYDKVFRVLKQKEATKLKTKKMMSRIYCEYTLHRVRCTELRFVLPHGK